MPINSLVNSQLLVDQAYSGAPTINANVGSIWRRIDGSTSSTVYVKVSGTDSTGWQVVNNVPQGAPSIGSGFGTGPSITGSNTGGFKITIGSSPSGTGTITLPAATNGWSCVAQNITSGSSVVVSQTATSTTSITLTAFSRTTGSTTNFNAGDVLVISCTPF